MRITSIFDDFAHQKRTSRRQLPVLFLAKKSNRISDCFFVVVISSRTEERGVLSSSRTSFFPLHGGHASRTLPS